MRRARATPLVVALTALAALLLAAAPAARAWGHTGHALTAEIAMRLLSDTTKQHLKRLLPAAGGDIAKIASWADEVKRTPRFAHTGPLHYSDAHDDPPLTCSYIFARDCADGKCVTAAIKEFTAILAEYRDHNPSLAAGEVEVVELGDAYAQENDSADVVDDDDIDDELAWLDEDDDADSTFSTLAPRHARFDALSRRNRRNRRNRQRRPPKGRRQPRRPPRHAPGNGRKSRRRPTQPGKQPATPLPPPPRSGEPITYTPEEALKFLVHLIQDVHQPMHLTGKLRGGNDQAVQFGRAHTNLHAVWDTFMLEKALNEEYAGDALALATALLAKVNAEWRGDAALWTACPVSRPAPGTPTPPEQVALRAPRAFQLLASSDPATPPPRAGAGIAKILCPEVWAQGIDMVNCAGVWDQLREGEDLSGEYYKHNAATVLRLVAMGGVRLAAVLEAVFNPESLA